MLQFHFTSNFLCTGIPIDKSVLGIRKHEFKVALSVRNCQEILNNFIVSELSTCKHKTLSNRIKSEFGTYAV